MNKRQLFLNSFLGALGAEKIEWKEVKSEYVKGTVIYDRNKHDETQDFIWRITEFQTPDKNTQTLIDYINKEKLLDIDKLKIHVDKITVPNLNSQEIKESFDSLFSITVNMVDNGIETDIYFIHD